MPRILTEQEIAAFRNDGVTLVKNACDTQWLDRMNVVVAQQLDEPSNWANDPTPGRKADRFFTDRYLWKSNSEINAFVHQSGCAALAGQAMGCQSVRFYFDHLLVKEPGTNVPTPWHQDVPYWPFLGKQICSVWLALTESTVEASSLEFVRGSHLDDKYYMPETFGARKNHPSAWADQGQGEKCPDIEADRSAYDIVGFDVNPGDALLFSAWILHGARGNASTTTRRAAISTRWLGDDAIWHPHEGADPTISAADILIKPGQYPADDKVFPEIWSAS